MSALEAPSDKGEFRKQSLNSPVLMQAGDKVIVVGDQVVIVRDGSVIATRHLVGESEPIDNTATEQTLITHTVFWRSVPVPGQLQTMLSAVRNPSTNSIYFRFADGEELEFDSVESALSEVQYLDTEPLIARHALVLKALRNSPDGSNLHTMNGMKCAIDFNALTPFSIDIP